MMDRNDSNENRYINYKMDHEKVITKIMPLNIRSEFLIVFILHNEIKNKKEQ
jgi:hypothetical protein